MKVDDIRKAIAKEMIRRAAMLVEDPSPPNSLPQINAMLLAVYHQVLVSEAQQSNDGADNDLLWETFDITFRRLNEFNAMLAQEAVTPLECKARDITAHIMQGMWEVMQTREQG